MEEFREHAFKQVQGPSGPHLFRTSMDAYLADEEFVLTLSPIIPKTHRGARALPDRPSGLTRSGASEYTDAKLDPSVLALWTPEMVAQSMLNAGIELTVADRFVENDINGSILFTLKFEDLKELSIQSFGIRTRVWHQIQALRDSRPLSPRPPTPIEDIPSREARRESESKNETVMQRRPSVKQTSPCRVVADEDVIHPKDSRSIIGIEQVIPKIHHCSKGDRCKKWRRQQKSIEQLKMLHPAIDFKDGGTIMICGDAGNPETARAIDPNEMARPISDAVASVVASSDVLGTDGLPPLQYLQEATLGSLRTRDPQENVRQFLAYQKPNPISDHVPPTPPFELTPASTAHPALRRLPKLSIPGHPQQQRPVPLCASPPAQPVETHEPASALGHAVPHRPEEPSQATDFFPYRMKRATAFTPDLEISRNLYRLGSPCSEVDVPLTAVPVGPVARDVSQSVPPDMNYRASPAKSPAGQPRSQSRMSCRRPSFPALPAVSEDVAAHQRNRSSGSEETSPPRRLSQQQQPLQPPPRFKYPWSPVDRTHFEHALSPLPPCRPGQAPDVKIAPTGITCQGPMKKRKTKLLRHEWQDGYFTLKGTRLNMHKDSQEIDRALEYIDIDDYAIACSSFASTSKLSAAFKAVHISHNRQKSDPIGGFSFQLIPQEKTPGIRLRKRDSSMGGLQSGTSEGQNGTGKTHHFAVKNRDQRIDWMRELMLAKAMKQKGQGFEVSVNGNMI